LWGGVRRNIEANDAEAQARYARLAGVRLSAEAQLATAWLQWVIATQQLAQMRQSEAALAEAWQLTQHQYRAGIVTDGVVAQAESQKILNEEIDAVSRIVTYAADIGARDAREALKEFRSELGELGVYGYTELPGGVQVYEFSLGNTQAIHNQAYLLAYRKRFPSRSTALLATDGQNFYRATTLLKDANGNYRDGELIKDDYVQDLLAGREYLGLIARSGKMYALAASPLKDGSGKVVGAVTMRVDIEEVIASLKEQLRDVHVAQTGHVSVVAEAFGDIKETYIAVHPSLEGKTMSEATEIAPYIAKMLEERNGTLSYEQHANGKNDTRLVAFRENPSLHWVVAVGTNLSEYTATYDRLRHITLICFVLIGVLLTGLITLLLGNRLRPLQAVMQGLEAFGRGNLRSHIPVVEHSDNEIDRVALAVNRSTHSMGTLVGAIRQTSSQVHDCASDMNTSTEDLNKAVRILTEGAREMSAESQQLSLSINQVAESANTADELATQAVKEVEVSMKLR
ncbi:MAG: Cache 3/Cache 2 fusion domain-containing protein, partial [Rhodocyclaceae bacterium]|nr:Cache 3/Cache 2 fusion domain-containing protein [Rhodocyclaceae bacterium]